MKYDIYTLSLLSTFEQYIPFMSEDDIRDILERGLTPCPWKVRSWEAMKVEKESIVNAALSHQK